MTQIQFRVLMGAAVILVLLLLLKGLLIQNTHKLSVELAQSQQEIIQGQAAKPLLNGIVSRLMRGTATEPDLADLLRQYELYPKGGIQ